MDSVQLRAKQDHTFDFEKLNVYQRALEFANEIFSHSSRFRSDIQYSLGDQLRRSTLSICNNLAEGSGKSSNGKRQFYGIALDSARECIPMLTIALLQRQFSEDQAISLRDKCVVICKMISRLISAS